MPLELGRPRGVPGAAARVAPRGGPTGDSTTMSQPFAFALVLGWGTPAGVVALGAAGLVYALAGGHPGP